MHKIKDTKRGINSTKSLTILLTLWGKAEFLKNLGSKE